MEERDGVSELAARCDGRVPVGRVVPVALDLLHEAVDKRNSLLGDEDVAANGPMGAEFEPGAPPPFGLTTGSDTTFLPTSISAPFLPPRYVATSADHAFIRIEREAQRALDLLLETEKTMRAPEVQRMSDEITVTRDHDEEQQEALRRAITLGVADVKVPSAYGTFNENPTSEAAEAPLLSGSRRRMAVWAEL